MEELLSKQPETLRNEAEKTAIKNRLKRIEGQVRGIQKMVEDDRYCIDILVQISAISAALKRVGHDLTEGHIKHCVSDAVKSGEGEPVIDELMDVLKHISK